jgi:hypothetical protein
LSSALSIGARIPSTMFVMTALDLATAGESGEEADGEPQHAA